MPGNALFVGHSLVGPTMPVMFDSFMASAGLAVRADAQVINGAPLRWNWDNGASAEGVNARAVLPSGDYDIVVVTEAIPLADQIQWNDTEGYAKRFADLAHASNPSTQFYLYETWHPIGASTADWRAQITGDLATWEGIVDHINTNAPAGAKPALIVPAGQALANLHDAISAGQVPGLSSIRDIFDDDIHFNDIGAWFIAALHAEVLVGVDAATLPLTTFSPYGEPFEGPTAAMAQAMNTVIDATLASYDRDGVGEGVAPPPAPVQPPAPTPDPEPEPEPTAPPVVQPPAPQPAKELSNDPGLGFGLSAVADYAPASPFLDVFKSSRPFVGHETDRWGTFDHQSLEARDIFDANGWPTEIPSGVAAIGTVILTEFPAEMTEAAGRYRVTWQGDGELAISFGGSNATYGDNEAWFTYTPDGATMVGIDIRSTDPDRTGDYIRDIRVVHEDNLTAYQQGEIFTPAWLDIIEDAHALRFMDWMNTNTTTIAQPEDAPQVADASWAEDGVPLSVMVRLANETQSDPWFTLPHLASEAYIRAFVTEVRDALDPTLTPYFEFSNEVWNTEFPQGWAALDEAQARFPGVSSGWVQVHAGDAVRMAEIIDEVYGTSSPNAIKVIGTQTGWRGLEDAILNAPDWVAEDPGNRAAPSTYFDVYAITGYFDGGLGQGEKAELVLGWIAESEARAEAAAGGLTGLARDNYIAEHRYDYATDLAVREIRDGSITGNPLGTVAALRDLFDYHKAQADAAGLQLVMYEGGSHVVGIGEWFNNSTLAEFFSHLNYTAEMGELYAEVLEHWVDAGGTLFNAYTAVDRSTAFGSWGHLRHLNDDNPRMEALEDFLQAYPNNAAPVPGAITGTETANTLIGTGAADVIMGLAGDDRLIGEGGNDTLDGGSGWDTAEFSERQASHTLTVSSSGIEITNRAANDTDQLMDIEALQFADGYLALPQMTGGVTLSAAQMESLIELYIAYFNRAPDAFGLNFWATAHARGMSLSEIAAEFTDQPETAMQYPAGTSTETFINTVYDNVLGRTPDAEGFAFWEDALSTGRVARDQFILSVLEGAKAAPAPGMPPSFIAQQNADRTYLADKTDIGAHFAVHRGLSDVDEASAVMDLFDGSGTSFDQAVNQTEAFADQSETFVMQLVGVLDATDFL